MGPILFISSNPRTRRRWLEGLRTRERNVMALAPGAAAFREVTGLLAAIVVDIDFAIDWQCFRALGQMKRSLTAPLIVVTSWNAPDSRYQNMAFRVGCDAFLSKPCGVDELLTVIDRLANCSPLEREDQSS